MIRRALSALFCLWFAIVLGDPGVLHACPEHGAHAGHAAAAGHTSHHAASANHEAPAKNAGGCTCIGSCCAAAVAAPLPTIATFTVSAKIVAPLAQPEYSDDAQVTSADGLLPFANGPPQA